MRAFQLDQNADHKDLAAECNAEGRCTVRRLPAELRNKDDPVVLRELFTRGAPILTMDFPIVHDNRDHIGRGNSGIIVVKARPNTAKELSKMLQRFKAKFPHWPDVDWSELYLEIDADEIYLSRLIDGNINAGITIRFGLDKFDDQVNQAIADLRIQPRTA